MSNTPTGYMMTVLEEQMFQLIMDLMDWEECSFRERHNYCYSHHYGLELGDKCPVQEAKDLLEEYGFDLEKLND